MPFRFQEQAVTFETAKLAKEKGFNMVATILEYNTETGELENNRDYIPHDYNVRGLLSAPTQSQLQKWLRDEIGYHLEIISDVSDDKQTVWWTIGYMIDLRREAHEYEAPEYTYEEALEKGLREGLNYITIEDKNKTHEKLNKH